jgi:hypothetical protein
MPERKKSLPRITPENLRPPYDEFEGEEAGGSAHVYFADADGLPAAERNPFRPDSRGFEMVNAWWLCEAATLAYSDPARVERIFKSKTPLQEFRAFATGGGKVRDLLPFGVGGRLDPRLFNHIPNALDDHVPTLYATHIWNARVEEQGG